MKALYHVLLQTLHESFSSWSGFCIEVQTGSCLDLSLCQNCCEVGFVCFFSSATVRSTINRISLLWREHQASIALRGAVIATLAADLLSASSLVERVLPQFHP